MTVVTAVGSDILNVVGDRIRVLVNGAESQSAFELFLFEGDLGSAPRPRAHPWLEAYYVLDGNLLSEIGDEQILAEAAPQPLPTVDRCTGSRSPANRALHRRYDRQGRIGLLP